MISVQIEAAAPSPQIREPLELSALGDPPPGFWRRIREALEFAANVFAFCALILLAFVVTTPFLYVFHEVRAWRAQDPGNDALESARTTMLLWLGAVSLVVITRT